jgi:hypothetical protein
MTKALLPLEIYFRNLAEKHPNELPGTHDYVATYSSILSTLREKIYPAIDIGLTIKEGGIYSFHNGDHFDEVVKKAGELIGTKQLEKDLKNPNVIENDTRLHAYEIFALLISIRIHDAGNCFGRKEHEKKCEEILSEVHASGFPYRDLERMTLANIAQAHGGELPGGDKDKIGALPANDGIGGSQIRSQRIAALLRFADELAENSMRTPEILLRSGSIPKKNEVYHEYAKSLQSNVIEKHDNLSKVRLHFLILNEDARKKFGKDDSEIFLFDEISNRLLKMNQERIYCNRFLHAHERIESISAKIQIRNSSNSSVCWSEEILIRDEGYPSDVKLSKSFKPGLNGQAICATLSEMEN